jgi:hypothetical protein
MVRDDCGHTILIHKPIILTPFTFLFVIVNRIYSWVLAAMARKVFAPSASTQEEVCGIVHIITCAYWRLDSYCKIR